MSDSPSDVDEVDITSTSLGVIHVSRDKLTVMSPGRYICCQASKNCRLLTLKGGEKKCDCSEVTGQCKVDQQKVREFDFGIGRKNQFLNQEISL